MFNPFVAVTVVLVIASAAVHATGRRGFSCWLLVLVPVAFCGGILHDLSQGVGRLGQGAIDSDRDQLGFCLLVLAFSFLAALFPRRPLLFWTAWLFNAFVCCILLYAIFFWKVFS
jgi:hypothetical protein